jgi:proteasome lid subunit RPN8/RPN11
MKITLSPEQDSLIKETVLQEYPKEMCGFLTKDFFIKVKNIHEEPENFLRVDPIDFNCFSKDSIAFVHSHTVKKGQRPVFDVRTPSYMDSLGQKASGLPWLIVGTEGKNVLPPLQYPPPRNNNYLERPFVWFVKDCYVLVQDYFYFEKGISLPNSFIPENYFSLRNKDNLFDEFMKGYPFKFEKFNGKVNNGDILLLDNKGFKRNHLGIFRNGKILHQDMFSIEVPYEHFIGQIREKLIYTGETYEH